MTCRMPCMLRLAGVLPVFLSAAGSIAAPLVFQGRIIPPPDREAVGYTVCLEHHEGRRGTPPLSFLLEAPVDADGVFRIEAEPGEQQYTLFIRDGSGRTLTGFPHLRQDRDFGEIALRADGGLMGTLMAPGGEPAAGVTVAIDRRLEGRCAHYLDAGTTVTDAEGAFVFEALNTGPYRLRVDSDHFAHPAHVVDVLDDLNYVELHLTPIMTVQGRLLDEQGDPVPDAQLTLQPDAGRSSIEGAPVAQFGPEFGRAVSGPDGGFSLRITSEGRYAVRIDAPEHYGDISPIEIQADTRELAPMVLVRGQTIDGVLSEADGTPVAGARVRLHGHMVLAEGRDRTWISRSARTEETGAFRIGGLPEGDYSLRFMDAESWEELLALNDVPSGTEGLMALLAPMRTIAVRVVDPEGTPVAGAGVDIRKGEQIDRFGLQPSSDEPGSLTDDEGRVFLDVRHGAHYIVSARKHPWLEARNKLDLTADLDPPDEVLLRLEVGRTVSGTVWDQEESILAGAYVRIAEGDPVATDDRGRFRIEGVAPGWTTLSVHADEEGEALLVTQRLEVEDGTPNTDVRVVLPRAGGVRGTVRDFFGNPVANAQIVLRAMPASTFFGRGGDAFYRAESDAVARFQFESVIPGTYVLMASLPGEDSATPLMRMIEVRAGETLSADLPMDAP